MPKMTLQQLKADADMPDSVATWDDAAVHIRSLQLDRETNQAMRQELERAQDENGKLTAKAEELKRQRDDALFALGVAIVQSGRYRSEAIDQVADEIANYAARLARDLAAERAADA